MVAILLVETAMLGHINALMKSAGLCGVRLREVFVQFVDLLANLFTRNRIRMPQIKEYVLTSELAVIQPFSWLIRVEEDLGDKFFFQ